VGRDEFTRNKKKKDIKDRNCLSQKGRINLADQRRKGGKMFTGRKEGANMLRKKGGKNVKSRFRCREKEKFTEITRGKHANGEGKKRQ